MSAFAELAPSLRPLVLLLSSDKPGEVAAAAAQITRQLERAGLDWHDLADVLEAEPVTRIVYRDREPEPEPEPDHDWRDIAEWCAARGELLSECEAEFVASMARILRRPRTRPTAKQAKWLGAIFDRLREDCAA